MCFIQGISPYRAVNTFHRGYKADQLITYKEKAAVCSEIRTKHSAQIENHVKFFNVKPGGT
jgi:hypothetical protein